MSDRHRVLSPPVVHDLGPSAALAIVLSSAPRFGLISPQHVSQRDDAAIMVISFSDSCSDVAAATAASRRK